MSKKKRQITNLQFKITIGIFLFLIIALFYLGFIENRFMVKEDWVGQELLTKDHLSYDTEFCANKLTQLVHEFHFLDMDIKSEKAQLGTEELLKEQEKEVIQIEQRELNEVKEEFYDYVKLCDEFDNNPTFEICDVFLQEAKDDLDVAQKNADESTGIKHIKITIKSLRNANRIYKGLKVACSNLK